VERGTAFNVCSRLVGGFITRGCLCTLVCVFVLVVLSPGGARALYSAAHSRAVNVNSSNFAPHLMTSLAHTAHDDKFGTALHDKFGTALDDKCYTV
jgi:hypothetical protein